MKRNLLLLILFLLLFCSGVLLGSSALTVNEIFSSPIAGLRAVRILGAFVIGGSLALSGLVFQAVLKNLLAEPFTLGIAGGSGVGAALAIILGLKAITFFAVPF
ncbi:MAG: iron chelate uptake ABC transporter family permease subunit, partial [Lentisphaeria bacterium]|nr:iron chelate uptake ABC transporter family permease subunit [Lentisphaeria bacterium]